MKRRQAKESRLLNLIATILNEEISPAERQAREKAKQRLEKKEYLPRIVKDLETELRPLAIKSNLTAPLKSLYKELVNHSLQDKELGRGLVIFGHNF